jgi:hypothetical protein
MERLGDVLLSNIHALAGTTNHERKCQHIVLSYKKANSEFFFESFDVNIEPIDFFSMINKLLVGAGGWKAANLCRPIAKQLYFLDQLIPKNRKTLLLSGTILTSIEN